MRRVLQRYAVPFAAIIAIIAMGLGVSAYILGNQRFYLPKWVPVIGSDFVDYTIDFKTAKAVSPGQGQTVTIAGVNVGEIADVQLNQGRGRVTVKIQRRYANRVRTDASALLRPRTPLQDMIIYLEPGTKSAPALPPGGNIPAAQTMTPTEFDEIISEFDVDTRAYLALLLMEGANALDEDGGRDFGRLLRGLEPTTVYGGKIAAAIKTRDAELSRAVTNLSTVADAFAKNDEALGTFIASSAETFDTVGKNREQLASVIRKSPGALDSMERLLNEGGELAGDLGTASRKLERPTRKLDDGLRNLVGLMNASTPVIRDSLRPFARDAQDPLNRLKPAVDDLAASSGDVNQGAEVLRQLFEGLSYKPKSPDLSAVTLAGYLAHASMSLTGIQDAAGGMGRAVLYMDCTVFNLTDQIRPQSPAARAGIDLLGLPKQSDSLSNGTPISTACR